MGVTRRAARIIAQKATERHHDANDRISLIPLTVTTIFLHPAEDLPPCVLTKQFPELYYLYIRAVEAEEFDWIGGAVLAEVVRK
jgi:hypothetical protein